MRDQCSAAEKNFEIYRRALDEMERQRDFKKRKLQAAIAVLNGLVGVMRARAPESFVDVTNDCIMTLLKKHWQRATVLELDSGTLRNFKDAHDLLGTGEIVPISSLPLICPQIRTKPRRWPLSRRTHSWVWCGAEAAPKLSGWAGRIFARRARA